jgi:hypothetical protein
MELTLNVKQMVEQYVDQITKPLGLECADPTSATLSPGRSTSFQFIVGYQLADDVIYLFLKHCKTTQQPTTKNLMKPIAG